ncbi:MAG: hypothetical protein ACT4OF_03640 [Caulobacteraceae bacterium]
MRIAIVALALALVACAPEANDRENRAACHATANDMWRPEGGGEFSIEATSAGPDCERAVATLVIRDGEGQVAWTEAFPTEHVMVLASARDTGAMRTALAQWIDPAGNTTMQTSSALPEWPANAESPQSGEFPFYPEEGYDRESYTALRANNLPLYCYVQGMESMACLALGDGELTKIGAQSFPG